MSFRREIRWEPGFDYRGDPGKKQYGCHGMQIRFLLHGEKATVQFLLYTGWLPTWEGQLNKSVPFIPSDVGYHADDPQYDSQSEMKCDHRASGKCYYDGSALMADSAFKILVRDGEEALWSFLEEKYRAWFETAEDPCVVAHS